MGGGGREGRKTVASVVRSHSYELAEEISVCDCTDGLFTCSLSLQHVTAYTATISSTYTLHAHLIEVAILFQTAHIPYTGE